MSGAAVLRFKKLKGGGKLAMAARHNKREIQAEFGASRSIDPTRTHLNEALYGPPTAEAVVLQAQAQMDGAGVGALRKDAVRAIEAVFSLPLNFAGDDRSFFMDCAKWASARFGGWQNILSVDVHRDEAAKHCHVLILPLIGQRMIGSDLIGNRKTLADHIDSFFAIVGVRYGLTRQARLQGSEREIAFALLLKGLRERKDAALASAIWPSIREALERDPGPHIEALGVELPTKVKKVRTMTQIFTSPGKGKKHGRSPIGFGAPGGRSLCSVGFAAAPPTPLEPISARTGLSSETAGAKIEAEKIERIRERDQRPEWFDSETGEFLEPPEAFSQAAVTAQR